MTSRSPAPSTASPPQTASSPPSPPSVPSVPARPSIRPPPHLPPPLPPPFSTNPLELQLPEQQLPGQQPAQRRGHPPDPLSPRPDPSPAPRTLPAPPTSANPLAASPPNQPDLRQPSLDPSSQNQPRINSFNITSAFFRSISRPRLRSLFTVATGCPSTAATSSGDISSPYRSTTAAL